MLLARCVSGNVLPKSFQTAQRDALPILPYFAVKHNSVERAQSIHKPLPCRIPFLAGRRYPLIFRLSNSSTRSSSICSRASSWIELLVRPAPSDVEELRRLSPNDADEPIDLLTCEVVQNALTERRQSKDRF